MKAKVWAWFVIIQLLGCACASPSADLVVRQLGAVLLLPSTIVLLVAGPKLASRIMSSTLSEAFAIIVFFSINATCWVLVSRLLRKPNTPRTITEP
jgi:hypothetical protein